VSLRGVSLDTGEVPLKTAGALVYAEAHVHIIKHPNIGSLKGFLLGFKETLGTTDGVGAVRFKFGDFFVSL